MVRPVRRTWSGPILHALWKWDTGFIQFGTSGIPFVRSGEGGFNMVYAWYYGLVINVIIVPDVFYEAA